MSGPKCLGYSIDPEALRELRRHRAAAARCERLLGRFEALGIAAAPLPGGYWERPSVEELEQWNQAAAAELHRVESQYRDAAPSHHWNADAEQAHGSRSSRSAAMADATAVDGAAVGGPVRQAEELLQRLDGLEGADVEASRLLLQRAAADRADLSEAEVAVVERACETAEAEFERQYVASKIEEAFNDAGLEVGDSFATHVVAGNEAYAAARSSEAHAVGVRMDEGRLDLRVVRSAGQPDAAHDADTELEFCKDLGKISASLHQAGVTLDVISHQQPGAVEVAVVPGARPRRLGRRAKPRPERTATGASQTGRQRTSRRQGTQSFGDSEAASGRRGRATSRSQAGRRSRRRDPERGARRRRAADGVPRGHTRARQVDERR